MGSPEGISVMDRCCVESFVNKGFREGFKLAVFGDRHTCETCRQVYELKRVQERERLPPAGTIGPFEFVVSEPDSVLHYTWQPVTH